MGSDFVSALLRLMADHSATGTLGSAPPGSSYEQPVVDSSETRRGSSGVGSTTARSNPGRSANEALRNPPETDRPLSPAMRRRQLALRLGVAKKGRKLGGKTRKSGRMY